MKAKVIKTGEIIEVYHEPQHGQITNIYKEAVLVNGKMWEENELDFSINSEVNLEKEVINWWNAHYSGKDYTFEGYAGHYLENSTVIEIAKHFFELGLKAQKGD